METFEKEITYLTVAFDPESETAKEVEITKVATFKELSRLDKTQAKLHFKLISLFEGISQDEDKNDSESIGISSDGLYDITVKAINCLHVSTPEFTEQDKKDCLNDSMALLQFGMWLFKEKFSVFFSTFKMT